MRYEIPVFKSANILIVGDLMLDRYWSGATRRVSPEAPVPIVRVTDIEERAGGAGNVALNVAALGARCTLLAAVGEDDAADTLRRILDDAGVNTELQKNGAQTTVKLRVLSQHQQLLRLDFEQTDGISEHRGLLQRLQSLVAQHDVVVFSDYGKGALAEVEQMIAICKAAGKPILVDPKGNDFKRYAGATLMTPNADEFQAVVGRCDADAEFDERAAQLAAALHMRAVLVTRGEHGMTLAHADGDVLHIAAQAREVFDVTGAGDTVIATLAAALAVGCADEHAVHLANAAAGVVVGKLGAATVGVAELKRQRQRSGDGVMNEDELRLAVQQARANGETIVMTNGCFDILHAGHVHYLNQAAALADRLIVAVNTDDSVRALKGGDRPVNDLPSRMAVLAALAAVDWVAPFSEATPERLICLLKPDFLVKGGDNDPREVPGTDCVREAGGQVLALDYVEGRSTTDIIGQIRG